MSPNSQPAPCALRPILRNGALASPAHNGAAANLGWFPLEVSDFPAELPAAAGDSVVQRLRPRGISPSTPPAASVLPELAAVEVNPPQRVLLTHVFTDIVASTETVERIGDRAWCHLLLQHNSLVREHVKTHRGREIDAAGDGFYLVFGCPSRAVTFALAVRTALTGIGIKIRIGIHSGECEVASGRIVGVSVHTAARITDAAAAGEILVSNTVRELVAGSEYRFGKKDMQVLKGLSENRQLFALA